MVMRNCIQLNSSMNTMRFKFDLKGSSY